MEDSLFDLPRPARYKAIVCEVIYREACLCAAQSKCMVDLDFLPQGLHDLESVEMAARVQERVDLATPTAYSAVVLGFALCNMGIVGVRAREIPIVIPRAHDCITLFLGSQARYREFFDASPGTYYKTTGWVERDISPEKMRGTSKMEKLGLDKTYAEYVEKYGEENAKYIWDTLQGGLRYYDRLGYIEMGEGAPLPYPEIVRAEAEKRGWAYEEIPGDLSLMRRLFDGDWDEADFLVVPPGRGIVATNDELIVGIG